MMDLRKFVDKVSFLVKHFGIYYMPKCLRRRYLNRQLASLSEEDNRLVQARVDYYVSCNNNSIIPHDFRLCGEEKPSIVKLEDYRYPWGRKKKFSAYFLDLYRSVGTFPGHYLMAYLFGDIRKEYEFPFFVKTRPIRAVSNSVLLKLNSARHFQWTEDTIPFRDKKDMAVSRNYVRRQPWRARLLEKYVCNPLCDFGMVNDDDYKDHPEWKKGYLSKKDQLTYKFIMCLEGNDVATNLKWVMSSNSLAVMPKPKFESWFMEGRLRGGYHYVEIADDFSDLEDKIKFYSTHIDEAESIIKHAHMWVQQFQDNRIEQIAELSVVKEYFKRTGQIDEKENLIPT